MSEAIFRLPQGKQRVSFDETGSTGLRRAGGVILEEFLPQLRGKLAIRTFREMRENDPVVGATLLAIEMLIRQVEWRVEGGRKSDAKFVEECMNDMESSWEDTVASILSMLPFGFALHEIVYKRRDGLDQRNPKRRSKHSDKKVGWRKFAPRAQDTIEEWIWDEEERELVGAKQRIEYPKYDIVPLPMQKMLHFRTSTHKDNPEGRSVLRNAYRPWFFKRRIEEFEAIGIERDLAGMPVMYVPPELLMSTASPEQKEMLTEIKRIVQGVKRDEREGLVLPMVVDPETKQPIYKFELLSTGSRRQFQTTDIVNRYDARIAGTSLADFLILGHEKVGSFALSSSKTNLFSTAIGAWLLAIAAVVNRQAIPRLFQVNGMDTDKLPEVVPGDIETVDLQELGAFITQLAGAGAPLFPDEDLETYLREQANLPPPSKEALAHREEQEAMMREQHESGMPGFGEMGGGFGGGNGGNGGAGPPRPTFDFGRGGGVQKRDARGRFAKHQPSVSDVHVDAPLGRKKKPRRRKVEKHQGPGPHPSGSEQTVHGRKGPGGGSAGSRGRSHSGGGAPGTQVAASQLALSLRERAEAQEPAVSALMKSLAGEMGGELRGFEHRLKNAERLRQKIERYKKERGIDEVAASNLVTDSIRYTMEFGTDRYTDGLRNALSTLQSRGYSLIKRKNYWLRGDAYNGFNLVFQTRDGVNVELQFHTPESLKAKELNHSLYVKFQNAAERESRVKLWEKMIETADAAPLPAKYSELVSIDDLIREEMPKRAKPEDEKPVRGEAVRSGEARYALLDLEGNPQGYFRRRYTPGQHFSLERETDSGTVDETAELLRYLIGLDDLAERVKNEEPDAAPRKA